MDDSTPPEEGALITDEIAEANLLAEQGDHDGAMARCQRLLLSDPENSAVHACIGDIHRRLRNWQQAAESYEHSLRIEYDADVMAKLAETRGHIAALLGRTAVAHEEPAPELPELEHPTVALPQRTKLLLLAAALLLVVAIVALVIGLGRPRTTGGREGGRRVTAATPVLGTRGPQPPGATPVAPGEPAPQPGITSARPPAGSGVTATGPIHVGPPQPMANRQPRITSGGAHGPMTDRDALLMRTLSSLTWPGGEEMGNHVSVMYDPFTGYAMITFETPASVTKANLYGIVLTEAYAIALAAVREEAGLRTMTVRCLTRVGEGDDASTDVCFRGNTSRDALEAMTRRGGMPTVQDIWTSVFAVNWWNPGVPTG
jgi:hypothetical protein